MPRQLALLFARFVCPTGNRPVVPLPLVCRSTVGWLAGAALFGLALVAAGDELDPLVDLSPAVPVVRYVELADDSLQPAEPEMPSAEPEVPATEPSPLTELERLLASPVLVPGPPPATLTEVAAELATALPPGYAVAPVDRSTPAAVTRIDYDQIWSSGVRSLNELFDIYVPNAQVIRHHAQPPHLGFRGIISDKDDKYLLRVNGRLMNNRSQIGAFSEHYLPMLGDIHHIDVIRGPGSTTYHDEMVSTIREITVRSFRGVSFQLAMPLSAASWKLTPLISRTMVSATKTENGIMTKVTAYRLRRLVAHAGTICQMGVLMVGLTAIAAAGEPTPRPDPGSSGIADPFVPVVSYVQPPAAEPPPAEAQPAEPSALAELEQLLERPVLVPALEQEVTTVSRQESTVGRSPAAVFVITNDMIRRSGARSIPEVLRMAPGVHVARIDANKWAVTVRGFNSQFANKLLVQIDGRSIYTPFFGGVFWDTQDVVLEDVERIEVIRGPGATVWGANAVNGIINIITKKAGDTQGALVQGGAGTELRGSTTARYGGQLGENAHYRLYGQWYEQDRGYLPGNLAADDGGMGRGGFRVDWEPNPCDTVTVQGESYRGRAGNRNLFPDPTFPPPDLDFLRTVAEDTGLQGGHALFRYRHECDEDTDWSCQVYYDRTERHRPVTGFREDRDTIDLDFQHRFRWTPAQEIIWGFGYRNTKGKLRDFPAVVEFEPPVRADDLFSYFVQDEITLCEEFLYLTAGSKFEHNDYTSFEFQPTVRLLCTPTPRQSLWAAVSRAVRMPTQGEDDVRLPFLPQSTPLGPVFPQMVGSRSVEAEDLLAYEAGLRAQPTDRFSWDLAVFLHEYRDLVGLLPGAIPGDLIGWPDPLLGPYVSLPLGVRNLVDGQSYGAELAVNYEVTPCWRLYGAYSYFHLDLDAPRGVFSTSPPGQDPAHQLYLRSSWDLACHWELDVAWRYVDALSGLGVPGYNVADVRLAYRPTTAWELAVVGRQLLADKHPEFGADPFTGNVSTEVESEVYGMVTWRY